MLSLPPRIPATSRPPRHRVCPPFQTSIAATFRISSTSWCARRGFAAAGPCSATADPRPAACARCSANHGPPQTPPPPLRPHPCPPGVPRPGQAEGPHAQQHRAHPRVAPRADGRPRRLRRARRTPVRRLPPIHARGVRMRQHVGPRVHHRPPPPHPWPGNRTSTLARAARSRRSQTPASSWVHPRH
jgi:hypothetical protein